MTGIDVEKIAELARDAAGVQTVTLQDGQVAALVPEGYRIETLVKDGQIFAPMPPRIRQHVKLTAKESFIAYANDFKTASRVFADLAGGRFVAALDYHRTDMPARVDHVATFTLQDSEEWKRWNSINGKLMGQADFARWLEENLADIGAPEGADVLEVVRDMSAKKSVNFSSAVRLANGDTAFEYVEETRAASKTGALEVPTMFVLSIPVFYGEPAVQQRAFLRWSINDGSLKIGIELHRPAYVRQAVFEAIGRDIADATQLPLHYGTLA